MNVVPFRDDQDTLPSHDEGKVRIWLGCNQNPREGWVNVDIEPFKGVDVVADLEKPWPWPDNHADLIGCADLPEHLRMWWEEPDPELLQNADKYLGVEDADIGAGRYLSDEDISVASLRGALRATMEAIRRPKRTYGIIHFMNEAWRVLKPGGRLDILVPSTDGRGWAQDPTHVSYWNENSLLYFCEPIYMNLYPHLIKCKYKPIKVATGIRNQLEVNWVRAIMEAVKE